MFEYEFSDFIPYLKKTNTDALAVYYENNVNQLKRNGTANFDENSIGTNFIEMPDLTIYNYCIPPYYVLKCSILLLIQEYSDEGNNPDVPYYFIPYLNISKEDKAFVFEGKRYDVGTIKVKTKCEKFLVNNKIY